MPRVLGQLFGGPPARATAAHKPKPSKERCAGDGENLASRPGADRDAHGRMIDVGMGPGDGPFGHNPRAGSRSRKILSIRTRAGDGPYGPSTYRWLSNEYLENHFTEGAP